MSITSSINPPFELLIFQPFGIVSRIPIFANGALPSRTLPSMLIGGFSARRDDLLFQRQMVGSTDFQGRGRPDHGGEHDYRRANIHMPTLQGEGIPRGL